MAFVKMNMVYAWRCLFMESYFCVFTSCVWRYAIESNESWGAAAYTIILCRAIPLFLMGCISFRWKCVLSRFKDTDKWYSDTEFYWIGKLVTHKITHLSRYLYYIQIHTRPIIQILSQCKHIGRQLLKWHFSSSLSANK